MISNFPVELEYFVKRQTTVDWVIPTRTLHLHELVFIIDGSGQVCIEDKTYTAKSGDMFYFMPNVEHSLCTTHAPYMSFYAVHFTPLNSGENLPIKEYFHIESPYLLMEQFRTLHKAWLQNSNFSSTATWQKNLTLQQIVLETVNQCTQMHAPTHVCLIKKAQEFIHNNLENKITLGDLTAAVNIEKTLLIQIFKEHTGQTPMRYVTHCRISKAKALLLSAGKKESIADIAKKCGYDDVFYFSNSFKKECDCSPLNYRKHRYT